MDDFFKMDVFFVTATISLIVVTALLSIVCVYALRVMRKIDQMASLALDESERIKEDIDHLRADIRKKGIQVGNIVALLTGPAKRIRTKKVSK